MSTVALRCPKCGVWIRVAVQASKIVIVDEEQLKVFFDMQTVAHICKETR